MRSMNGNSRRRRDERQRSTGDQRVDQDVPLATLDLLARVVARRIKDQTRFLSALAVCELMIATAGLASRPTSSRTATYSA